VMFQSTRPRGARHTERIARFRGTVSIHAPARGATVTQEKQFTRNGFQSTRPRGARRYAAAVTASLLQFQSTRPRGARPQRYGAPCLSSGFNPRARAGRDKVQRNPDTRLRVSIHAPARGATPVFLRRLRRR